MASGFGEFTASLIVSVLVPLTGYIFQDLHLNFNLLILLAPLFFVHIAMLIAFEVPDYDADKIAQKTTITVRLKPANAFLLHSLLLCISFGLLFYLAVIKNPAVKFSIFLFPLGIVQVFLFDRAVRNPTQRYYQFLTAAAISVFALSAFSLLLGTLIRDIPTIIKGLPVLRGIFDAPILSILWMHPIH